MKRASATGKDALGTRRHRAGGGANPLLAVTLPAWRSKLLVFLLFFGFAALAIKVFYLQGGVKTDFLLRQGEARYARTLEVAATRGRVTDRNGVVLAASVPAFAVWAIPDDVQASSAEVEQLARLLEVKATELRRRLDDEDRTFVYLRRQVEAEVVARIKALRLEGIHVSQEFKRHYPEGASAAHLVGFTGVDEQGQEGVELAFESTLAGRTGSRRVIKDRLGRVIEGDWLRIPRDGQDLTLALDNRVQFIATAALRQAVTAQRAKAGAAIVLDTHTGEVLALANWPNFDPNAAGTQRRGWNPQALRNRVLTDSFEPGSTLKPFSIATALDVGNVRAESVIQTGNGRLTIGGRTIGDTHPHAMLTVAQVVARSSNVGTARIALDLPAQTLWNSYTAVGFGQAPRVGFNGAVAGRLRPYKSWRPIEQATIAYGYGVSVSLLQLARAYLVFARDGDLPPISLTRVDAPVSGVQVFKPETARTMRRMLEAAASNEGTAPLARVAGYRVAGKTGTARKLVNGRYVNSYVGSFVGFAPASDPRIVVAVMIDEPGNGAYYGGVVAAPVFSQVVAGTLRLLQVPPDAVPVEAVPARRLALLTAEKAR